MSLFERWSGVLEELLRQGRYRTLAAPAGVDFTSNDYLGYGSGARRPSNGGRWVVDGGWLAGSASDGCEPEASATTKPDDVAKLLSLNLSHSGMASRLLRGHHPLWEEVESELARWHGAEAALVMNSGYVANEGLLSTVLTPQDWVASDELNHASIIDGLRLARAERYIYHHNDLNQLEAALKAAATSRPAGRELFVVTESLFSMEGDRAPLAELARLAERHGAHLIVDEAHATGCLGPRGSGLVDAAGIRRSVLSTVHTGGKALGSPGAYVCGSRQLRELLVNRCRHLIFTTALPPVAAAWWLEVLPLVQADEAGRALLRDNATRLRARLAAGGVALAGGDYIVPVRIGADERAVRAAGLLQGRGFDIRAIRPPTVPAGTSRLRLAVHADHECGTLEEAARAVLTVVHQVQSER